MKKLVKQILILTAALLLFCLVGRLLIRNTYTLRIDKNMLPGDPGAFPKENGVPFPGDLKFTLDENDPDVVKFGDIRVRDGYVEIEVTPKEPGRAGYDMTSSDDAEYYMYKIFNVTRLRTVYDHATGGFTGDSIILAAVTIFFLGIAILMLRFFLSQKEEQLYTYDGIYTAGFSLFAGLTGIVLLIVLVGHVAHPVSFTMRTAYYWITTAAYQFMRLTLPFIVVFSLLMLISNLALLRHERPRLQNLLGILAAVILICGEGLGLYLNARFFSGSERELIIRNTWQNVYCTAYAYFECMLAGSVICAWRAVRHKPSMDRDYIIILGCRFRKDGTLTPLLKGRCDRAIAFWRVQKETTGKEAVLIPSGGQGSDEPMPEAEAMARYLRKCGIPDRVILPEGRSKNTYQNMSFSKKLIENGTKTARVVYSTTNYHLFRSGVWAGLAGLRAEGIGCKTKWWFWPNAFLRECVGLVANRIRQELILLVVITAIFAVLTMMLGV